MSNAQTNKLFYRDNLEVLRRYIGDETIDLCYIDPPFNSKRNYNQIYNNIGHEHRAQAQAFIDTWTWDKASDIGIDEITSNYRGVYTKQNIDLILGLMNVLGKCSLMSYLVNMTQRIAEIFRVLKPTGSFYLHCDPTSSHYLKLVIDSIFCPQGGDYKNEIVWYYRRWTNVSNDFQRMHDIIFRYSKSEYYLFNKLYQSFSEKTIHREISIDGTTNLAEKRDIEKGIVMHDVWEIPYLNSQSKERLGYPTQKPEILLERIIKSSTNEDDTVLDAYCGCGTTVAVAERLNRRWIGIDITYQSISLILKRLEDHFGKEAINKIELNGVPRDFESAEALAHKEDDRLRKEFEKWAVLTYSNNKAIINEKKGGDKGIDGVAYIMDRDKNGKDNYYSILFSVKSNKILPPSVIRDLNGTMEREGAVMGFLISLYPMENLVRESKKYGIYDSKMFDYRCPKIQIINIQEILEGNVLNIPTPIEVLKKAESKRGKGNNHGSLFDE